MSVHQSYCILHTYITEGQSYLINPHRKLSNGCTQYLHVCVCVCVYCKGCSYVHICNCMTYVPTAVYQFQDPQPPTHTHTYKIIISIVIPCIFKYIWTQFYYTLCQCIFCIYFYIHVHTRGHLQWISTAISMRLAMEDSKTYLSLYSDSMSDFVKRRCVCMSLNKCSTDLWNQAGTRRCRQQWSHDRCHHYDTDCSRSHRC